MEEGVIGEEGGTVVVPERPKRAKNDVKEIRTIRQLEKVDFDLESPRFK